MKMIEQKMRIWILCGGQTPEHEVSLLSAANVVAAIDRDKFELVVVGIDKGGRWLLLDPEDFLLNPGDPERVAIKSSGRRIRVTPGAQPEEIFSLEDGTACGRADVVFPVMHGGSAEDGSLQGLLRILNIPFVGAGVLGSAVGMDKDVMKRLLQEASVSVGRFLTTTRPLPFSDVQKELGLPFFVKPANTGSSVGISKVRNEAEYTAALEDAFQYDTKILIEEFLEGREIECSVLGNENPEASVAGEIVPLREFYSYEAKYVDEDGARLIVPAELPDETLQALQRLAIRAYEVLCCEGMARVDFFLKGDGSLYINEINTLPGFTKISMYPKLWNSSGLSYGALIEKLINLAIERFERQMALKTSF